MNKFRKLFAFTLMAIFLTSMSAYAAPTYTEGDIYADPYTVENSSGNWEFTGKTSSKRQITLVTNPGLAATGGTVGTVTLAKSGYIFVLKPTANPVPGGVGYTLSLPSTASTVSGSFDGEWYQFATATGSTLSIRTASSTDSTIFFGKDNCTRITSPASSGSTVTVVGSGRSWFIVSMSAGGPSTGGWVAGTA